MDRSLYLIDGHAQIYRAYYAVIGLRSPTGEPTSATFGFVSAMLKLLQTRKPSHVILALDAGTSGRETLAVDYKAQRKPMPEDMPPQIDRIAQIVDIIGTPIYRAEGYEADDVIATLVRQTRNDPAHADCKIYMATKDKDLDQLIDDQVLMYDIQDEAEINAAALFAKKGYTPAQARDVLALTGDTSDNIQGIPGVGPKTAAKWIAKYGSIDNLLTHKDEIEGKIGEALRNNLTILDMSRKLVELQFDVPILPIDWNAAKVHPELLPKLAPIFHELGFAKLLNLLEHTVNQYRDQLPSLPAISPPTPSVPRANPPQPPPTSPSKPPSRKSPVPPTSPLGGLFAHLDQPTGAPDGNPLADFPTEEPADSIENQKSKIENPSHLGLAPVHGDYRLVNTAEKLDAMLNTLHDQIAQSPNRWLAVDTETDALGSMASNLCGISLSAKPATGYYIAIKGLAGETLDPAIVREKLAPILADPAIRKVGQNLKYDLNSLRKFGLTVNGNDFDTMVASYLIDSSRLSHGMDALAADYLQLRPIPISDLIGSGKSAITFADVPLDRATQYSAEDADVTLRLAHVLKPLLERIGGGGGNDMVKLFNDLEMPLVQVLADMEFAGVKIDTSILKKLSTDIEGKLVDLQQRIKQAAGIDFNQDSPRQLADVLFKQLKLPILKKTKTGPSTDITVLERLADKHPLPALIVEYRQLAKLKNTYLDTLSELPNPITGRVHAHFNQTVAETGRLASSDPNLQNIPIKTDLGREIRRAFIAEPGPLPHLLISADYSQVELRILAHYCAEPALLDAFAKNVDVHRLVAAELNHVPEDQVTPEMRAIAKTVNFGIIYGQTGFGLSQVLHIPQEQANQYISAYRHRFPAIENFTHECIQQASVYGYVTTILGRRRTITDINSNVQSRRQFGQRAALNSVIQGSAADLIKLAMVNIHKKIKDRPKDIQLLMTIHDELVFECRADLAEEMSKFIQHEMEHALPLKVPLKVDLTIGPNWLE